MFETLCALENSPEGYSRAVLGQYFSLDEIGRLEKIEVERRRLTRNDKEVFDSCIANLKKQGNQSKNVGGQDLLDLMRKNREKNKNE